MKTKFKFLLSLLLVGSTIMTINAQNREMRFYTKDALYAANEEWLTFACEVPEGQVDLGLKHQSEMYWYSLYNLGNLVFRSSMGIHAVNNPLFKKHVKEDKGMKWHKGFMMKTLGQRQFMMHKIAQVKARTGVYKSDNMFKGFGPPEGAFPVYLEYASGVPAFGKNPELEDFKTLRWDKKSFDKTLSPAAWGQSMTKAVLWARDFFNEHRTSGGVTYLGVSAGDGAHGFRGGMLLALTMAKTFALKSEMAYNAKTAELGGVDPQTYDPMKGAIYYPHKYEPKFKFMMMKSMMNMMIKGTVPPIVKKFVVTDPTSNLYDVASLLWGESEFYYITDPTIKDNFDLLFGDPMWTFNPKKVTDDELKGMFKKGKTIFPKDKPHMLAKGISVVNFKNMMGLHFAKANGTLVDEWHPTKGQGKHISTHFAGLAIVALANTYNRLHDVEKVKNGAKMLLTAQANFLLKQQASNGSIANGYDITGKADKGAPSLLAQTFAIRGWLAAYGITKDAKYLDAANKAYNYMESTLWSKSAGIYRSEEGATTSTYNGMNYGSTLGALRELAITRSGSERQQIVARMDNFFENIRNKNGLQLSEIDQTGEPIPSPEKGKEMEAKMKDLMKSDPEKGKKMQANMMDKDKDGVPKPKFVMGTDHGAAPVTAGKITISTK